MHLRRVPGGIAYFNRRLSSSRRSPLFTHSQCDSFFRRQRLMIRPLAVFARRLAAVAGYRGLSGPAMTWSTLSRKLLQGLRRGSIMLPTSACRKELGGWSARILRGWSKRVD
jgi:hypothetical protein